MADSMTPLARLKRQIEATGVPVTGRGAGLFALGDAALDARLGGGLARGCLHEIMAEECAGAAGFALMLAMRARAGEAAPKPILWVETDAIARMQGGLYGPGLTDLGLDPDGIILVRAPDEMAALRAAADIIGCFGVGAAIVDAGAGKRLDLTASRKLVLAAERAGVTGFMLRSAASQFASAASTRWRAASAPSTLYPGETPGRATLTLELLRHRGGVAPFSTLMEWDRDAQLFCEPGLSGALLPLPAGGTLVGSDGDRQAA